MKRPVTIILIFILCLGTSSVFSQTPVLSKNTLAIGIRGYSSFMRTFKKKTDTTFLRSGLGFYPGFFHNLNKKGNFCGVLSIGYDYFWTYKSKGLNSFSLGYDAYYASRGFILDAGINERYFLNNTRHDRLKDFEFEYGGGFIIRLGWLINRPVFGPFGIGLHYRQIGKNKMWYVGVFGCIPVKK
jgi:hypothetical protein